MKTSNSRSPGKPEVAARRRRTRNDFSNRNFMCGCGKAYLSYPALYTHLKQKHNGIQPNGTILPQVKFSSRAKNPKNNISREKLSESYTGNSSIPEEEEGLRDFLRFLDRYSLLSPIEEQTSDIAAIGEKNKEEKAIKGFPKEFFTRQEDYMVILSNLEEISKLAALKTDKNGKKTEVLLQPVSCNKIFARFLFEIAKHVREDWFREVCLFVCLLRRGLNSNGWRILAHQTEENLKQTEFCEVNNAEKVLEYCNEFITNSLPKSLKEFESLELELLGSDEEGMKNAVEFMQGFGNWLLVNGYTNIKIKKNYEEPD